MNPGHASDATFTIAGILVVLFVVLAMGFLLERRAANLFLNGFLAGSLGSPLIFVGQMDVGLAMMAVALACIVPAYRLALVDGGGGGGGGGEDSPPGDPPPDSGPDVWSEFEREFWSHVERTRELVRLMLAPLARRVAPLARPTGSFVFRDLVAG
jgi:hypothetical protein